MMFASIASLLMRQDVARIRGAGGSIATLLRRYVE